MNKSIFFAILVNAKMVINSEDVNNVSSNDIENKATLIDTFERDTDCEGVKVVYC